MIEKKIMFITASKLVVEEKQKITWIFRDQPENKTDTGWRVFSGNEDDQYMEMDNNFIDCPVDEILKIDNSIEQFLKKQVGSEFELDEQGEWEEIKGMGL
jgi:hypothetical protein